MKELKALANLKRGVKGCGEKKALKNNIMWEKEETKMNDNLELIYQEIKDRLKEQLLSIDQINTKHNLILGFNSIILVLLLQAYFSSKTIDNFLKIAGLMFFISIVIVLIGLLIRSYRRDPDPGGLYRKYKDKSVDETKAQLILNYISCFDDNKKRIKILKNLYEAGAIITAVAVFIIVIYLVKEVQ